MAMPDDEDLGETVSTDDIKSLPLPKQDITSKKRKRKNIFASTSEPGVVNATESTSPVEQILLVQSPPIKEPCKTPKQTIGTPSNGASSRDLLQAQRQVLPVYKAKKQLMDVVLANKTLIVVSETGSGKTTQIPQFLHELGITRRGCLAITQPRRVAAISIAKRVAEETETRLGGLVGYSIRFEEVTSPSTRIKYMTDGMLLREVLSDALLRKYSAIVLDEAHERTLRTDVLFGMVKKIRKVRKDLKVVIMSATLDAVKMAAYFEDAEIVNIPGRQYPVEIFHADDKQEDYLDAAVSATIQTHINQPANSGDILVFLTGQEEIESASSILAEASRDLPPTAPKLLIAPIYANLPVYQQTQVFDATPPDHRKIVLSTNICETSITLSGIRYVIDTGMCKSRGFNSKTGIEVLKVEPISKSSAKQRAGRAGREAPGKCFRLYTEKDYTMLNEDSTPEILRKNLASVILLLLASCGGGKSGEGMSVTELMEFQFLDPPPREALERGLENLYALGAISEGGRLTELGKSMAEFPVDPPYARVLIQSKSMKCVQEVISIVSMLSVENSVFHTPHDKREEASMARRKFTSFDGDHITLLNVLKAYDEVKWSKQWCIENFINSRSMKRVTDIRTQLRLFCQRSNLLPSTSDSVECQPTSSLHTENILRCFLSGFFMNAAICNPTDNTSGTSGFKTLIGNRPVYVHPSSVVFGKKVGAVFYNELVHTSRQYMRNVSVVNPSWFIEAAPHYYNHT
ncbi:hypothetical protein SeLEV6574_g00559 [Synchytrium endobioticum]|nr:hypothetical protein SeLEV6574_g00559 [Synchytrium endobioticum]